MKKNNKFEPLDAYEKALMKSIEEDELVEVENQTGEIVKMKNYVTNLPRKNKRITIRINEKDLAEIQDRAIEKGVPYQSLISLILRQYTKGNTTIEI